MKTKDSEWWFGQGFMLVISAMVGGAHGASIGLAVAFALGLLVDIRHECARRADAANVTPSGHVDG